ncbi:hypothetical protein PC129_g3227 [Phytophthora cactorum]|uniref:G protein gamma domain-containing protein n=1 Tax=Phytophthora cactorum TaxID=29920 RepID=A0A329SL22_9STRA|nr:hypothetical protein GQ600_56 [Phytophthora cactorum]KAG2764509.1 hypothetical protein Pcac1_g23891 [Phytophthora cactorum]KAG2847107.1 hypothetical protein PC111_g936 [Phytophthora cactorum]KAG2847919.1 hypothetical protein PC112_g920 [Phytophthora cactorum]KAG2867122.1 hypothetical protein PC113_g2250 [Phytophthora cactorum]
MARSATSEHREEVGRPASVSEDELEDAPGAFPDSEEEGEDDEETELEHAARAGIRLLEENAQLHEELHQLQEQCAQAESEKEELLRLVAEKEQQERQLSDHLRECIRENQGVLSELSKAKEQIDELKAQQAQAQTNRRSPGKRRSKRTSPRLKLQLQLDPSVGSFPFAGAADEPPSSEEPSPAHSGGSPDKPEFIPAVRRNSMPTVLESDSEVEAKFEEAHRRNSVLGRELASAHKQIGELKPLQLQLREFELEVQLLRAKVEEQAREIGSSVEEREEERELIASLRHTIEIYQTLDDPCATKLNETRSAPTRGDDDIPVSPRSSPRRLADRHRKRVDASVAPSSPLVPADNSYPALDERFSLRDENDRLLAELDHLGQQVLNLKLLEGISRTVRSPKKPSQGASSFASLFTPAAVEIQNQTESAVGPVGYGTSSRMRFLEQQASVLQDLLQRFRVQWKYEYATRRAVESDKADLLQRMEKMQALLRRQCLSCEKEREDLLSEGDDTSWENSAAVYETLVDHTEDCQTKEEQAEAEHICFSILRRLVDSWTTDKAKRMRLHDWLTNAIRGTGKRRPLYLYGLSGEIASGFQVLLVPILREKFGVEVQIEKRLRNVIVTDLKMQVTGADAAKAKACLQRISRSLLWLIDVESALIEDQEWVGEYARRKAAKMCANI